MNIELPLAARTNPGSSASRAWLLALEATSRATRDPRRILPRAAQEWAQTLGDRPALVSSRETLSYQALALRANVYARWGLRAGVRKGDAVALMMRNRPDYFALWLGLTQIGAVAALVSPDLQPAALAHALKVSRAARLIVDEDLAPVARAASSLLEAPVALWAHDTERADMASLARRDRGTLRGGAR